MSLCLDIYIPQAISRPLGALQSLVVFSCVWEKILLNRVCTCRFCLVRGPFLIAYLVVSTQNYLHDLSISNEHGYLRSENRTAANTIIYGRQNRQYVVTPRSTIMTMLSPLLIYYIMFMPTSNYNDFSHPYIILSWVFFLAWYIRLF